MKDKIGKSRHLLILLFPACALFLLGMSGMGTEDVTRRIPTPDMNYRVTVVDQADVRTQVTMFSINGYTVLLGRQGKGTLAVPFSQLKQADFRLKDQDLEVVLRLKDDHVVTLVAERKTDCFGKTKYGNYKIQLGDVRTLIIEGLVEPQPAAK
ncbi:MAG: hypothetical protein KKB20_08340 [Proteobacteria bacterium]|nr:hypothetical protein [Pseudomonadota bacterium]